MNQYDPRAHSVLERPSPVELRRALDCAQVRSAISKTTGAEVSEVTVTRVHFSGARPVTIHYCCRFAGGQEHKTLIGELTGQQGSAHYETERKRLCKPRRSQLQPDDEKSLFVLDGLGLVLRTPGLDSKLDGLRLLHDNSFAVDFLARLFGMPTCGSLAEVGLKAHRLGKTRRAVCEVLDVERLEPQRLYTPSPDNLCVRKHGL